MYPIKFEEGPGCKNDEFDQGNAQNHQTWWPLNFSSDCSGTGPERNDHVCSTLCFGPGWKVGTWGTEEKLWNSKIFDWTDSTWYLRNLVWLNMKWIVSWRSSLIAHILIYFRSPAFRTDHSMCIFSSMWSSFATHFLSSVVFWKAIDFDWAALVSVGDKRNFSVGMYSNFEM